MNIIQLPKEVIQKFSDKMTTFTLCDHKARCAFFDAGLFVSQMRAQHNLGILETLCLGQACLCVALFIPLMKGRERVVLKYETDGVIPGFSVEASSEGWVRGYLFEKHIPVTQELKSWDLSSFFGNGFLTVTRYIENGKEPTVGTIAITHKSIAQDVTEYFLQSEQTNTAIRVSVKFNKQGEVESAAGLLIQALPNATDEELEKIETTFSKLPSPAELCLSATSTEDLIKKAFGDLEPIILLSRDITFDCPCSREHFLSKLKLLQKSEIETLDESTEVICQNCSSSYSFLRSEILS